MPELTRSTWRRGKKAPYRVRKKPWGGKTVAPPEFLVAAKRTQFGAPGHVLPKCKHCKRYAVKGYSVCQKHGAARLQSLAGVRVKRDQQVWKDQRAHYIALLGAKAPLELQSLPVYRDASQAMRVKLVAAWNTEAWPKVVSEAKRLMDAMSPSM